MDKELEHLHQELEKMRNRIEELEEGISLNIFKVANEIVMEMKKNSAPGQSTWGDEYQEAHVNLFTDYFEDLVEDAAVILARNLKRR